MEMRNSLLQRTKKKKRYSISYVCNSKSNRFEKMEGQDLFSWFFFISTQKNQPDWNSHLRSIELSVTCNKIVLLQSLVGTFFTVVVLS